VREDERAQAEELVRDNGWLLRRDDDAGVEVPLLADDAEQGLGQLGGGAVIGEVLQVG
jgi:hypothetical protein